MIIINAALVAMSGYSTARVDTGGETKKCEKCFFLILVIKKIMLYFKFLVLNHVFHKASCFFLHML